jgi:hypothetical protein
MPIIRHKNYYQFGETGKRYYYLPGNAKSRQQALAKAKKQGRAIEWSKNKFKRY